MSSKRSQARIIGPPTGCREREPVGGETGRGRHLGRAVIGVPGGRTARFLVILLLGAAVLSVSSLFFLSMGKFTDGALSMPLDDSYIYFQYARGLSEGRFFRYSEGAQPSTGATSFLYTFLLAAGNSLGIRDDSVVLFAFVLGVSFLFASSLLVVGLLESLACGRIACAGAALLLIVNAYVAWSYLSGMEVGLFATSVLLTLFLYERERESGRFHKTSAAAAVMGFTRPEGVILALPVALLVYLESRGTSAVRRTVLSLVCLLGISQFYVNWMLTGSAASTGTQAKSVFHTQEPDVLAFYVGRFLHLSKDVLLLFLNNFNSLSWGPGWALVARAFLTCGLATAAAGFLLSKRYRNSTAFLLASWVVLSVFLSLVPWAWSVHNYRYQAPFFPIFIVIASAGFGILAGLVPRRLKFVSSVVLLVLFGATILSFIGATKKMALRYAHNCENIFHQQVLVGKWIRANTPGDAVVGLNDAGAIAYFGRRPVFDFVGLVTASQTLAWRSGIGSVVESLEHLSAEELPDILAIYPNWLPFFVTSGIARVELFRAHLELNTVCGGSDKVVYLPDWDLLGTGEPLPDPDEYRGLMVIDRLDVADLASEASHEYEPLGTWRSDARVRLDRRGHRMLDGGRRHFTGERMKARCLPDREILVLARLNSGGESVSLYVDGKLIASRRTGALDGPGHETRQDENPRQGRTSRHDEAPDQTPEWTYVEFRIPPQFVNSDRIALSVRLAPEETGRRPRESDEPPGYTSYHYWFLQ
ncbi:MAG: hypothetical protein V2A71_07640 [Candidatus Eisenbacteria bacterium]